VALVVAGIISANWYGSEKSQYELEGVLLDAHADAGTNRFEKAAADYDAVVALASQHPNRNLLADALVGRGHLLYRLGRYHEATDDLKQAYSIARGSATKAKAAALLTQIYARLHRSIDANNWFRRAARPAPPSATDRDSVESWEIYLSAVAISAEAGGRAESGLAELDRALTQARPVLSPRDPCVARLDSLAGWLELRCGRPGAAVPVLEDAIRRLASWRNWTRLERARARVVLAVAYRQTGRDDAANSQMVLAKNEMIEVLGSHHPFIAEAKIAYAAREAPAP
jgi:tetratricopeptide (TPR) repeat protein